MEEIKTDDINQYDFNFSLQDIESFCNERNVPTEKLINDLQSSNIIKRLTLLIPLMVEHF